MVSSISSSIFSLLCEGGQVVQGLLFLKNVADSCFSIVTYNNCATKFRLRAVATNFAKIGFFKSVCLVFGEIIAFLFCS